MKTITLGKTGITTPQNAFGALPIQRVSFEEASALLNRALDGGITYIDTARAYSDSEEKIAAAVALLREHNASATIITTPWEQLDGAQILAAMERTSADFIHELQEIMEHEELDDDECDDPDCCCHHHHHEHGHGKMKAALEELAAKIEAEAKSPAEAAAMLRAFDPAEHCCHGHDEDEEEHEHHHHHDHDHDEHEEHEHHHHHHHHHGHDADEVFTSWGV